MSECLFCGGEAKHFPLVGWFGDSEAYCCYCFTGSVECDYCEEEVVSMKEYEEESKWERILHDQLDENCESCEEEVANA